ncbi:uncharacterized protein CIMG_05428 [Coccidioides immitis RS]|uniref:Uncharacterized protein n=1 Tax=Coccidioides immitis (strain RS) TaxID=246410 RepID=J3KFJ5_COCIM|nr:uncharacterized protein CIMG_05428 [Coccidioides immitis RS]EAS34404.3 hypothetical protein CIMG_05428 [Coccidioides immitis RS]
MPTKKGEEKWEQRNGAEWQSSSLCQDVQVPRRRALGKPPLNSWGERHFAPLPLLGPVARALPFCDALRVFGTELAASTREREGSGGRWRRRERDLRAPSPVTCEPAEIALAPANHIALLRPAVDSLLAWLYLLSSSRPPSPRSHYRT